MYVITNLQSNAPCICVKPVVSPSLQFFTSDNGAKEDSEQFSNEVKNVSPAPTDYRYAFFFSVF